MTTVQTRNNLRLLTARSDILPNVLVQSHFILMITFYEIESFKGFFKSYAKSGFLKEITTTTTFPSAFEVETNCVTVKCAVVMSSRGKKKKSFYVDIQFSLRTTELYINQRKKRTFVTCFSFYFKQFYLLVIYNLLFCEYYFIIQQFIFVNDFLQKTIIPRAIQI